MHGLLSNKNIRIPEILLCFCCNQVSSKQQLILQLFMYWVLVGRYSVFNILLLLIQCLYPTQAVKVMVISNNKQHYYSDLNYFLTIFLHKILLPPFGTFMQLCILLMRDCFSVFEVGEQINYAVGEM